MPGMTATTLDLIHAGIDVVNKIVTKRGLVTHARIGPTITTKEGYHRERIITGLGDVGIVAPGNPVPTDSKLSLYQVDFYPLKFAKAYEFDYESENFDYYGEAVASISKDMATTFRRKKNKVMANVLNNGFSSTYAIYDAQPFFSTAHTGAPGITSTGWTNTPTVASALGSITIEEAMTNLYNQTDLRGELMEYEGNMRLHVPNALAPLGWRILEANGLAQTNNNDPNFSGKFVELDKQPFMTSATAWVVKMGNDDEHGVRMFQFAGYALKKGEDIRTLQKLVVGVELYSAGVVQWQGSFGNQGA